MRRALISLVIIGIVGATAVSLSRAFFSDVETSSGNILQAGKIDLKVDHAFASYNGNDCSEICEPNPNAPELVINGDFEELDVTTAQLWNIFPHPLIPGWSAEWVTTGGNGQPETANIELHAGVNSWLPQNGDQYTELDSDWDGPGGSINNEAALVRIYQDIPTEAGKKYQLSYWHSYRPGESAANNNMTVTWGGALVNSITGVAGNGQTSWVEYVHEVQGDGSPIRLQFEGGGPNNSFGVFLDNVSLKEKACTQDLEGGQCQLWNLKDLDEQNDSFFNIPDIKPGDFGVNVISLHVYDNNAWACAAVSGEDDENDLTDPEIEFGDVSEPEGELSQYINVFIWHDDNHNGIYEPLDEDDIYSGPFATNLPLAEPSNPALIASNDYYYGFAWCVGTQTINEDGSIDCNGQAVGNDAQTDIFTATLKFYAEQERNNPNFSCSEINI